jgi:preprotein translocase subunit SecE
MAKFSPAAFLRDVKQEIAKITWPTRSMALHGTIMVVVISVLLATFLFLINMIFAGIIKIVLGG